MSTNDLGPFLCTLIQVSLETHRSGHKCTTDQMQKPAKVDNFSFVIYPHTDVFNNHACKIKISILKKTVPYLLSSLY